MSGIRRSFAYGLLKAYKLTLSPLFMVFGTRCRHAPTCSEYGAECVSRFGIWRGSWMTLARFQRCRPGGSCGHDPVPDFANPAPFYTPWKYGDWALTERQFPVDGQHEDMKR